MWAQRPRCVSRSINARAGQTHQIGESRSLYRPSSATVRHKHDSIVFLFLFNEINRRVPPGGLEVQRGAAECAATAILRDGRGPIAGVIVSMDAV